MSAQNPWLRRALSGPRWLWRWLTSMRTALVLLFLLALGAIPGALLPQRSLNADKVDEYIANNGRVGEIYDKLQLYDVFSSVCGSPRFTCCCLCPSLGASFPVVGNIIAP